MVALMDGSKETRCPRHMLRENRKHCGVGSSLNDEYQSCWVAGEERELQITTEKERQQISVTKPQQSLQGNFLLQGFSVETIDRVSIELSSSKPSQPVNFGKCLDYMNRCLSEVETSTIHWARFYRTSLPMRDLFFFYLLFFLVSDRFDNVFLNSHHVLQTEKRQNSPASCAFI